MLLSIETQTSLHNLVTKQKQFSYSFILKISAILSVKFQYFCFYVSTSWEILTYYQEMSGVNSKNKEYPLLTITEIRLNINIVHLQCEISRSSHKLGFGSFKWHCVIGSVTPYIIKNHSELLDPQRWRYHDSTNIRNDLLVTQIHFSEELDLQQHSWKDNVPHGYI